MSRSRRTIFNGRKLPNGSPYRRATPNYPSAPDSGCSTQRLEHQQYSGTTVVGILNVHKSNYVPTTKGEASDPKRQP